MIDGTEKNIRKRAARYNEFDYKACGYLVVFVNFCNLFNLIIGLIGYLKTSRMTEPIYNVHL